MLGESAALLSALTVAAAAAFYRVGVKGANPFQANIARIWMTTPVILLSLPITGQFSAYSSMPAIAILVVAISGLSGTFIGDIFYFTSIRSIGVARTVPIVTTFPVFAAAEAVLMLGETLSVLVALGTGLVILGIWLLASRGPGAEFKAQLKGVAAAIVTSFLWATSMTTMGLAVRFVDPYPGTAMRLTIVALASVALLPAAGGIRGIKSLSKKTLLCMFLGGVAALIVGWLLFSYSLVLIGASKAVPLSSLAPLFSVAFALAFFKERVDAKICLGAALSVFGTILVATG